MRNVNLILMNTILLFENIKKEPRNINFVYKRIFFKDINKKKYFNEIRSGHFLNITNLHNL